MLLLILFAFLGGLVTILSPCILPILPIVLSGSLSGGKKRPFGIIAGFIFSFTVFTLTLTTIVRAFNLPPDILRLVAVATVFLFGLSLLIPQTQVLLEKFMQKFSGLAPKSTKDTGFFGGIVIGFSLGLVWTPCVGPILASIITLASTSQITLAAVAITLAYSLGTALPMLAITYSGRALLQKMPWLLSRSADIQKVFGVIMIITAVGIYFNVDRQFQAYILEKFPAYGEGLTAIEDNAAVQEELERLQGNEDRSLLNSISNFGRNPQPAPELAGGQEWINSQPLTLAQLEDENKVVLVDFWTYSCINCIRTLPYLTAWDEKYRDDGLVIIGVHSPEFAFERDLGNVQEAVSDFGIEYPVVQDNEFAIWQAYNNRYWPAKYLVNADGDIVYTHFGEGAYDETEQEIQRALKAAGAANVTSADLVNLEEFRHQTRTPETYLGYWRLKGFASPELVAEDEFKTYNYPPRLLLNETAFNGSWSINEKDAVPRDQSSLKIRFLSKQVNLVMRPMTENLSDGETVQVQVLIDGQPITAETAGEDVESGVVTLDKDRLYELYETDRPEEHELELIFDEGVQAFAFTFG